MYNKDLPSVVIINKSMLQKCFILHTIGFGSLRMMFASNCMDFEKRVDNEDKKHDIK